jgi:hypothetical protein
MKTLGDRVSDDHISTVLGVRLCPKCGMGTNSVYDVDMEADLSTLMGCECRECRLLWNVEIKNGTYTLTGVPHEPEEKHRTYEIVVTRTSHFINARTTEEAREKLIKKLKLKDSDKYGVYVEHCGDHAECNEGIC